jgi:Rhomboid-like protein
MTARLWRHRYAFATAYLACFVAIELGYVMATPHAQATLIAWASTNVANLEHEPVLPLVFSALVTPGYFGVWPVLIALAVFGANRALGNARTALVCLAGQVVGSLVSEGIVAYRVDAGQLDVANRYLTDVGPSYVVVSAIVIALACGTWLARALAAVDLVVLVFPGHIFGGLSQLDVSAVGHLTAALTAAAATTLLLTRRGRRSGGHLVDGQADQVGDPDRAGPQDQLPHRAPPERPCGQPGHQAPADDGGDGGEAERDGHHVQAE